MFCRHGCDCGVGGRRDDDPRDHDRVDQVIGSPADPSWVLRPRDDGSRLLRGPVEVDPPERDAADYCDHEGRDLGTGERAGIKPGGEAGADHHDGFADRDQDEALAPPCRSTATAQIHSRTRELPWTNPPASARDPLTRHHARIRWKFLRSTGSPITDTVNALRPTCITRYAEPTIRPDRPNAVGRAAEETRLMAASTSSSSRTAISAGSSQFVTQVV